VLEDADIDMAIEAAIKFRCLNAGQICTAPKRFIIDKKHYEKFKDGLIEGIKTKKHGDPLKQETEIGPLANEGLL
jgi:succinate-semialdehyde dehydrogenase / glutarate-semialdehyde dehydrogenase